MGTGEVPHLGKSRIDTQMINQQTDQQLAASYVTLLADLHHCNLVTCDFRGRGIGENLLGSVDRARASCWVGGFMVIEFGNALLLVDPGFLVAMASLDP